MKNIRLLMLLLAAMAAFAAPAAAQNKVVVERDSVFIQSAEGVRVPISSAEVKARLDEYGPKRHDLDELLALYQKIAAMREQSFRLRDEEQILENLRREVEEKEKSLTKNAPNKDGTAKKQ